MIVAGGFAMACADSPTTVKNSNGNTTKALGNVVTGAGFTTTDPGIDGTPHCKNGNEAVNCNIYDGKQYVWLNGGPNTAQIGGAGDYFFAVLVPSGQGSNDNPNDGTINNLSDFTPNPTTNTGAGDAYTNRTFHLDGAGHVSYSGTHTFDPSNGKIRLFGYDNTTNPGGVYIMAICSLSNGYPVSPSDCKYDAFKVKQTTPPPGVDALTASVSISPTATNGIGEQHVFTISYSVSGGTRPYYISVTPSISPVIAFTTTCPNDPLSPLVTSGGTGTYSNTCTMTINSSVAGVFTANAAIDVVDSGDPQLQASDATDALGGSGPAVKTYVDASLSWNKTSDYPGGALAGATFKIERTADRFGAALSPSSPIITGIVDCVASPCSGADQDPAGGAFRVVGLPFGTWVITETAPPPGYNLASPAYQTVTITNLSSPSGSAALPFVDPLIWIGETATVQGYPWSATRNAPANWFMYAPWVTTGSVIGISAVGPPAGTWLIAGQHYQAGRVYQGAGAARSIRIDLASGFRFSAVSNNVKINPMSCTTAQNYVQPGQFSVKATASVVANSITVSGLAVRDCYGVHVDVQRNPLINP
ncbi:MAG TPA: prealbumin-like fold domain-containing protein [Gemmatimonadaceae bacterium]|nr:prealbumin-like fold domain-containing protein [Gemmatimonadaceae bacterium]